MPPVLRIGYKPDVRRAPSRWWLDAIERAAVETAPRLIDNVVIVTSANDGKHMQGSRHYSDEGEDLRFTGARPGGIEAAYYAELLALPQPGNWIEYVQIQQRVAREGWAPALRKKLSADFDVVYESDHIHVEHDPKAVVQIGAVAGG